MSDHADSSDESIVKFSKVASSNGIAQRDQMYEEDGAAQEVAPSTSPEPSFYPADYVQGRPSSMAASGDYSTTPNSAFIDHVDSQHTPRDPSSGRAPVGAHRFRDGHAKASAPYTRTPDKRKTHKLAERRRRKEVRELFDELRDQIPGEQGSKASKWEVLSKAIEHVNALQQERDALFDEVQTLRASVGNTSAAAEDDMEQYDEEQVAAGAEAEEDGYSYNHEEACADESAAGDGAGNQERYEGEEGAPAGESELLGPQSENASERNTRNYA